MSIKSVDKKSIVKALADFPECIHYGCFGNHDNNCSVNTDVCKICKCVTPEPIKIAYERKVSISLPANRVPKWCNNADDIRLYITEQLNLHPSEVKGVGVGFSHKNDSWEMRGCTLRAVEDVVTEFKTFRPRTNRG